MRTGWRVGILLLVVCALALGGWTALAQTISVGPTTNPLPGSQFQGGDGNQDNATGLIDWQGLQAEGQVDHTSDPQTNDNVFAGGSEELNPDGWGLTTQNGGATPASGNVLDIYRAFDHPQGGDAFLYLAFTREASQGTIYVTFELNQDDRTWTNAQNATIPCRTTGDLLLSFDNHGNTADVEIDRWVTNTAAPNGCARTGHLDPASNLTPNGNVQGAFNYTSSISNFLPGFYGGTVPVLTFGESAINLTKVMSDFPNPCAVFGSTWMHSRASLSDTAAMKDYVAPKAFHIRLCKAQPKLSSSASGVVTRKARSKHRLRRHKLLTRSATISDTATLSDGDNPTGTITFNLFGPGDDDCSGTPVFTDTKAANGNGSYQSGAFPVTAPGTYRWVVHYSGDRKNQAAGPTKCGEDTETVTVNKASPTLTSQTSGPTHLERIGVGPPRRHRFRIERVHDVRATQPVFDTATLSDGIAPTGRLTFRLYGPGDSDCSGDPIFTSHVTVNGNGPYTSDPFTPAHAGTYRWTVDYSGDNLNEGAGPTQCGLASETFQVNKALPAIVTVASPAVEVGHPITDDATLTRGANPTGTITFRVYGPHDADCSGDPAHTSTVTVDRGNATYTSEPFTPTTAGIYRWVAEYSGDSDNEGVSTSCNDEGENVVVGPPPPVQPTLSTTASAGAPAGSQIHDTAHLANGDNPTGTITFRVYGPDNSDCSPPPAHISSVTVSGNGDYTSSFRPTKAGTYHWVASYSGDEHNKPVGPTVCDDPAETVTVTKATPSIHTVALPVAPIGFSVRDRALLIRGSSPTGHITFALYGPTDATCSGTPVFSMDQNINGNGLYHSSWFVPQQAGLYHWVATYTGDDNNERAATGCGDRGENVLVLPRRPRLTTSASPPANVRKGPRTQTAGRSIYDAATLRFGFSPTGHITFELFGPSDSTCSGTPIFTTATEVNGNGVYNSEAFVPTASGTYRWIATYSGDGNNRSVGPTACGDPSEHVDIVIPADPALTSSASEAVTLGGAIHDTAHLSGGSAPTGTITFRLFGPNNDDCSGDPAFTSTVNVAGNGDYDSASFTPTKAGVYHWVVRYSGDHNNHGAGPTACGDTAEIAIVRPPAIVPVTPAFSTTASASAGLGAPVHDVAHLSGGVSPFGTITFSLFGPDDATCSKAPAFTTTAAVNGNGDYRSADFVPGTQGTYRWVVTYSGDAMNNGVGPTACGESTETTVVSANVSPDVDPPSPNVPTPPLPPPKPKPKPKPKPPPSPPPPRVTG
jgi:hypothetical protein